MTRQVLAWLAVLAAIAGVAGGLGYYKYAEIHQALAAAASTPEQQEAVEAVTIRKGEWQASTKAVGTAVALRQVEIRNELPGTLVKVGFSSGDIVEEGQVLVRFDARQEEAELEAALAEARLAGLTFERRKSLRSSSAVSVQDLDKAREEFSAATSRALSLERGIEKKTIKAPFRARVGLTDLQPGAYLEAGSLLATLQGVDLDAYVDFSLPQDVTAVIRPGVSVKLVGPQLPFGMATATIIAEDASVDVNNRAVRYRALASGLGDALRPGAFIDVVATTELPRPVLYAPLTAVRRSPYGEHVYLLVDEEGQMRARQRIVKTGPVQGSEVVIIEGLSEGDLIAAAGSFKLREGLLVDVGDPVTATQQSLIN